MRATRHDAKRNARRCRAALVDDRTRVFLCDPDHGERADLERFVVACYRREHDAEIAYFLPTLMGIEGADGRLLGAIGVRDATSPGPLFLETYLDEPVERGLARASGQDVAREAIAEIGNLASATPGGGRILVTAFAHYLDALGLEWAVFTATLPLRNSFRKLGVELLDLGAADPGRLPDRGLSWGRYYETDPRVTAVRIRDVCRLSRTHRRFAGPMGPVRRAALRVGIDRRGETRAA